MFGNMVSKLKEAQNLMEETKTRMESVYVDSEVDNGNVKVVINVNKKIKDISINDCLLSVSEKDKLEKLIASAMNIAMEKADKIFEAEMQGMTKGLFPSFPFLF